MNVEKVKRLAKGLEERIGEKSDRHVFFSQLAGVMSLTRNLLDAIAEPLDDGPVTPEWIAEQWVVKEIGDTFVVFPGSYHFFYRSGQVILNGLVFVVIESRDHFAELAKALRFEEVQP